MKLKVITGTMLILLSASLLTGFNAPALASGTSLTGEISIGALLPMTGDLATFGENEKVAAELAVGEVNEFLQEAEANWTMKLVVEDTVTEPDICLEKVESLGARGIKLLLGPLSSAEVRAIKGYCDTNKILAISHASTAPDLAIPDDYIFRFCPQDRLGQGRAIGRIMYDDGKRYIIPVTRNDAWGVGLEEAGKLKFEDLGGEFLTGIRYSPEATEFSAEAADLASKVKDALADPAINETNLAVWHISFEEVNAFMTACAAYAVLDDVKWYGSDGTALSEAMLEDPDVRDFTMSVEYPCTIFAPTESAKYEKVRQHCIDVLGREPDSYAYIAYDIVWVYALSLLEVDAYDSETVKAILPTVTQNYFGASGWIELDENGDRKAGDYDIWQLTEIAPGTYDWVRVGRYIQSTDSVIWGPYYQLTVTSSPITGITFTINGASKTTPYTEWLLEGSYTLVMPETHNGYVWSHWLEDGDTNRIKIITLQGTTWTAIYVPAPPPPVGGKATPINIATNKPETPALWIWLTTIIPPLIATAIFLKHKKKKQ